MQSSRFIPKALGWHPDLPDFRDLSASDAVVGELLQCLPAPVESMPVSVDLREYFTQDVPDQGTTPASSAFACTALVEYFEYRAHGRLVEPSRLFLHQATQKLNGTRSSPTCDLRSTLKVMARLGVPPEERWPYAVEQMPQEATDPYLFSFADDYRSIRYVRLDEANTTGMRTLEVVKSYLSAGFAVAFGFPVPNSLTYDGRIDFRPTFDSIRGGQAVVAVGYDDQSVTSSKGALIVRSSWGRTWGEGGYGWLPYVFVERQLATSFWTLMKPQWLDSGEFQRPSAGATFAGRSPPS